MTKKYLKYVKQKLPACPSFSGILQIILNAMQNYFLVDKYPI